MCRLPVWMFILLFLPEPHKPYQAKCREYDINRTDYYKNNHIIHNFPEIKIDSILQLISCTIQRPTIGTLGVLAAARLKFRHCFPYTYLVKKSMNKKIKAMLFDVDETLFDRVLAQKAVLELIIRQLPRVFPGYSAGARAGGIFKIRSNLH